MKKLIVGNWKMHLDVPGSSLLIARVQHEIKGGSSAVVVVCPSFTSLFACHRELQAYKEPKMVLGAQNVSQFEEGEYTGEVSATQLKGLVRYVIIGHSQRRLYYSETDEQISKKISQALRYKLKPILCVGETLKQRHDKLATQTVLDQLDEDLDMVTATDLGKIAIAYEPIWAIGTGEFAKPAQVEEMVQLIFDVLRQKFGEEAAQKVRILYGGSVDDQNSTTYLALPHVSGLLVGGASLNYRKFAKIINNLG
ncbi:triose-phosphate isomerase [Candidatus Saccharibacteria bacterium]|nr:triose-phosphate isomerase [Candidatus Saccharibacteria bacterium]